MLAVEKSGNKKTGYTSATYAPIASCPMDCALKDNGCYAQAGPCAIHVNRLDKKAVNKTPLQIARIESKAIDKLSGIRPLRLHVSGDCRTTKAALELAMAADRYKAKYGSSVWTYTHAWQKIPRAAWGSISVLASCETLIDSLQAMEKGYASALIVSDFDECKIPIAQIDKLGFLIEVTMKPCPAQIKENVTCNGCRICWDDTRLLKTKTIVCFLPHGAKAKTVKELIK